MTGLPATTRAAIVKRAKVWLAAKVPYSMVKFWSDGYRQDCSGFVSMAWNLGSNEWTGSLNKYGTRVTREQLQPGDMLLFHNPSNPQKGSHVVLFGGWTDYTHTYYVAYEQTPPRARKQSTPYAYWSNSSHYVPYRYKGLKQEEKAAVGGSASTAFPGARSFGAGAGNANVTRLGKLLVDRGGGGSTRPDPGRAGVRPTGSPRRRSSARRAGRARTPTACPGPRPGPIWSAARARTFRPSPGTRSARLRRVEGAALSRARHVPAGREQRVRHPARQATGEEGVRQELHEWPGPPLGRDRPAGRRGVPAVPGLARRRGRRLPGARDLATALLVNAHRPAAGGA